jgi:hypothetical protein
MRKIEVMDVEIKVVVLSYDNKPDLEVLKAAKRSLERQIIRYEQDNRANPSR